MSDFIFSTKLIEETKIRDAMYSIYTEYLPPITYFKGPWGSLGLSGNIYNGFEPYETDKYITIVIGGPLLTFQDNVFITEKNSYEGTKAIFERWKTNEMTWDQDLNGPFSVLIVDKETNSILCVTDIMSFIPVYKYTNDIEYTISSHVDMLSEVTNKIEDFDEVSLTDFILHGTVTYPFTTFNDIFQIQPASEHFYIQENKEVSVKSYWEPFETHEYTSIKKTAELLREELIFYIEMITANTKNIAQFISGGEDSRTLSGLLKDTNRDAYIYLDSMNREGKLAKVIAQRYNANFKLSTRDRLHYLNILENCTDLIGSGAEYHHAHTYDFHKEIENYHAVFGGLFSDALLKGARVKKTRITKKFPFLPERKYKRNLINENIIFEYFTNDILEKLVYRRKEHFKYIKRYRKESAEEWFELWPSSMNRNIPNIYANRRLFKSYEPFLSNEIVKISADIPQQWKLNRVLFHKVARPYLKLSKGVLHGDGWYPYFSWKVNAIVGFITWTNRQVGRRIGFIKGNQGPWAEWKSITNNEQWEVRLKDYLGSINGVSQNFENILKDLKNNPSVSVLQYIALTQVLYQLQKRGHDEE